MAEYELRIQNAFVDWLSKEKDYKEHVSDPNGGSGALMDSIGMVADQAVLIEFKYKLTLSGIRYSPEKTTSIERKICKTIERLYSNRLLPSWRPDSVPLIYVVAAEIGADARSLLRSLLEERSTDWCFAYNFGEWGSLGYRSFGEGPSDLPSSAAISDVRFQEMPAAKQNRQAPRTIDQLSAIAKTNLVGHLFDLFMELAAKSDSTYQCNLKNVLFEARSGSTGKSLNSIGLWPIKSSSQNGLLVTYTPKRLAECFSINSTVLEKGPWKRAPMQGFLDKAVYLTNPEEVLDFWAAVTGARG
jgi:hypothetical protein